MVDCARKLFDQNKPKHGALHWDGKLMTTVMGESVEWESILVSGAPHYNEGKLLSVTSLTNEDGNPASTGAAMQIL